MIKVFFFFIFVIIFLSFFSLVLFSGFMQSSEIDNRDNRTWEFDDNGVIVGSESFEIDGSKDTCWILIHSYTSTPKEMVEVSNRISLELGDYIYVPRLSGHGVLPSKIVDKDLNDWYLEIKEDYDELNLECDKINILGSSFGGTISAKLAQEEDLKNVYLVNPFFGIPMKDYYVFRPEFYLRVFADTLQYSKKMKIAQINSKEAREDHVSYWNMPFQPIKNSLSFIFEVESNASSVDEPILVLHSHFDKTASSKYVEEFYNQTSSEIKSIEWFDESNHLLLLDYQKEEVFNSIIEFEKKNR